VVAASLAWRWSQEAREGDGGPLAWVANAFALVNILGVVAVLLT
jgi:hypothetical protein